MSGSQEAEACHPCNLHSLRLCFFHRGGLRHENNFDGHSRMSCPVLTFPGCHLLQQSGNSSQALPEGSWGSGGPGT